MGCSSCGNKNMSDPINQPKPSIPTPKAITHQSPQFRKEAEIPQQNTISKKISMIKSFATALTSRGLTNEKVSKATKQLRVLSCFGDGNILPPCEQLKKSKEPGKNFCGGCGCGDKKGTWLISNADSYSKLDYPKLACPLQMPGFSNYQESAPDEAVSPITRRHYIENVSYRDLDKINVSLPEPPPQPKDTDPKTTDPK